MLQYYCYDRLSVKVNNVKSHCIVFGNTRRRNIEATRLGDDSINWVESINYLGAGAALPYELGGHDPPLFEAKGDGGHNLGIIHISHIALITPLH